LEVSKISKSRFSLQRKGTHIFVAVQVNPIAGLLPDHSPLPATGKMNGILFRELLCEIVERSLQKTAHGDSFQGSSAADTSISSPIFADI
jgi:hypothetical protein